MIFRQLLLSNKKNLGRQCGKCGGVEAKRRFGRQFNALILIPSEN